MFRIAIICLWFCLAIIGAGELCAQHIAFRKLFEKEDGLSEREILDVHRDQVGKFWLFSNSGIQRFDGSRFESIKIPKELYLNNLDKVSNLSSGELAIQFHDRNSVILFNPMLMHFNPLPDLMTPLRQQSYFVDQNILHRVTVQRDSIFTSIRSSNGEFRDKSFMSTYSTESKVVNVEMIGNSYYLLLESGDLLRCSEGNCRRVMEGVKELVGKINDVIWIKNKDNLIHSIDEQGVILQLFDEQYNRIIMRSDKYNRTLVALTNNTFTIEKLLLYNSSGITAYDEILHVEHSILSFYADDFSEQLLLATHHGLWVFKLGNTIKNYLVDTTTYQGFGNIIRSPFYRNIDSSIYFVREQRGLFRIVNHELDTILPNTKYPNVFTKNMKVRYDSLTDRLYGIRYDLINKSRLTTFDFQDQSYHEIRIPFEPYEMKVIGSELWMVGSENDAYGVFYRLNIDTKEIIYKEKFDDRVVDFLIVDRRIYLGAANGLLVVDLSDDNKISSETAITLLPDMSVNCLMKLNDHVLVGTRGSGLYVLEQDTVLHHVAINDGMLNNTIASIQKDHNGNIWLATFYGLTVLDAEYNFIKNITTFDGLPDDGFNTLASFVGDDGRMYFGTVNGLATFYPEDLLHDSATPSLVIDEVLFINDHARVSIPVRDSSVIQLPYGVDSFHLGYHVYDYIYDESHSNLSMQLHATSSKSSDQLVALNHYISTRTREYGKRTININRENPFNGHITKLAYIHVETQSFISRFIYYILSSLLTVALLFFLIRVQRQRRREQEQFKEAEYKAELSRFQLQALQSQMNPHFIFNALGSIQYFIHKNEAEIADGFLSDFASLMRLTLESSKSDMISLRDELKLLTLYVKLEHLRFEELFDYSFEVDDEADDDFNVPPMMLQPFIENAINHGFPDLKGRKGHLSIKFSSVDDDTLTCIIHDNGVGRQAGIQNTKKKHKSRGMQIVRERIESLKFSGVLDLSVTVDDLMEGENAMGTKVTVVFAY